LVARLLPYAAGVVVLAFIDGAHVTRHILHSNSRWSFADDARVLIHPLFRVEVPTLFPQDPTADYYLDCLPVGYRLLYETVGRVVGIGVLSKVLPYVLSLITLACLAAVCRKLSGPAAAIGAIALALGSSFLLGRAAGGLPRAFASPLLAAGMLSLVTGRIDTLAGLVVLATAFYPVVGALLGVCLVGELLLPARLRGTAEHWSKKRRIGVAAAVAALAIAMLAPTAIVLRPWGPQITPSMLSQYPEAGARGRFSPVDRAPFPPLPAAAMAPLKSAVIGDGPPFAGAASLAVRKPVPLAILGMLGLFGLGWLARRRIEALRLLVLVGSVIVCHSLSRAFEPRLFLPERYVAYSVPLLAFVALPSLFGSLATSARKLLRLLPVVWNLALVLLLGGRVSELAGLTINVPPEDRELYRSLRTLPQDAVIAGWPDEITDSIPYLTRRSVFVTREMHMPFHRRFTDMMRGRMFALMRAYFATTRAPLLELRDRYHVTHLLLDREYLKHRPTYFAPFDATAVSGFAAATRSSFVAFQAIPEAAVMKTSHYVVLDLSRL
jgi:hypothetical protein